MNCHTLMDLQCVSGLGARLHVSHLRIIRVCRFATWKWKQTHVTSANDVECMSARVCVTVCVRHCVEQRGASKTELEHTSTGVVFSMPSLHLPCVSFSVFFFTCATGSCALSSSCPPTTRYAPPVLPTAPASSPLNLQTTTPLPTMIFYDSGHVF